MAKQKKDIQLATTQISYQGKLTVQLVNGKKVLSTKKYHNNGCDNLFKFICNCLAGMFSDTARPSRIALFNITAEKPEDIDIKKFTQDTKVTPFISNDVAAIVGQLGTTVTYHFKIPFTYIQEGSKVNAAALYSRNSSDPTEDACAYFLFTTEDGLDWDIIDFGNLRGNFSLIIEWTMSVNNAIMED